MLEQNIPPTPLERLSQPVKDVLSRDNYVFDCHVHIFDKHCINEEYFLVRSILEGILPWYSFIPKKYSTKSFANPKKDNQFEAIYEFIKTNEQIPEWEEIINTLQEYESEDKNFVKSGKRIPLPFLIFLLKNSTEMKAIFDEFVKKYALTTLARFAKKELITCILMMDLGKTWNGQVSKTASQQVTELRELCKTKAILPFLALDPRRADDLGSENLYSLFNQAFSPGEGCFFGIKIYPALGYLPSDYRLDPIFKICEEYQIPIVTHCGGETVSTFEGSIWVYDGEDKVKKTAQNRTALAFELNAPENWIKVLEKYPDLRLNFAHFASWEKSTKARYQPRIDTIKDLMQKYKNVYTDFSYNLIYDSAYPDLNQTVQDYPDLENKLLYGTDFWVVLFGENLVEAQDRFFKGINPTLVPKITYNNPKQFLF